MLKCYVHGDNVSTLPANDNDNGDGNEKGVTATAIMWAPLYLYFFKESSDEHEKIGVDVLDYLLHRTDVNQNLY